MSWRGAGMGYQLAVYDLADDMVRQTKQVLVASHTLSRAAHDESSHTQLSIGKEVYLVSMALVQRRSDHPTSFVTRLLPFQKPFIELIGKLLFVAGAKGRRTSCLYAATPHRFHKISDIEPLFDVFFCEQFPSRT